MKHFPIAVLLPLLISLLLMTGCKKAVPQAESAEYAPSTEGSVPEQSTPGLSPGISCQAPELTEAGFFVSLYHYDCQMQRNDLWQWSYHFQNVLSIEYDMYAPPVRFDGDKSLWMTYSWSVISPVRHISTASFDVAAITALVFEE